MIPEVLSEDYVADAGLRQRYRARHQLVRSADAVLALSEATARDGIERLGLDPGRVTVVGAGVSSRFVVAGPGSDRGPVGVDGLRGPFVLYTGGADPRKNVEGLLAAWAHLPQPLRSSHQLVVVCSLSPSERNHLEVAATRAGIADHVLLTGFVDDDTLVRLYQTTELFVFPSRYEGYGLPIAEALACGAPVVASDRSCLPELVPPAGLFNPDDPNDIARAITAALDDPPTRRALLTHTGRAPHTWSDVAAATAAVYDHLTTASRPPRRPPRPRPTPARPRLAFVSPLPPQPSGVADYSALLLEALQPLADITAFIDGPPHYRPQQHATITPAGIDTHPVAALEHVEALTGPYDAVIYSLGNSEFHTGALAALQRRPGIVLAHDVRLTGLHAFAPHQHPRALTARGPTPSTPPSTPCTPTSPPNSATPAHSPTPKPTTTASSWPETPSPPPPTSSPPPTTPPPSPASTPTPTTDTKSAPSRQVRRTRRGICSISSAGRRPIIGRGKAPGRSGPARAGALRPHRGPEQHVPQPGNQPVCVGVGGGVGGGGAGLGGGVVVRPELALPVGVESLVASGKLCPADEVVFGPGSVLHVASPYELSVPLDRLWPDAARRVGAKLVVTLHDLIPEALSEDYVADAGLRQRYRARHQLVRIADAVIAVSTSTARDGIERLGLDPRRVHVIGEGVSSRFVVAGPGSDRGPVGVDGLRGPFVLYTGGADPRKNVEGLLAAWAHLPRPLRSSHQLVVVCSLSPSERNHLEVAATRAGIADHVLLTGFVDDDTLVRLYQTTELFVFPSRYEGYGLPIAEALACGAPVVASDRSCLPELVPPAGLFNPDDPNDIARAITAALDDPPTRRALLTHTGRAPTPGPTSPPPPPPSTTTSPPHPDPRAPTTTPTHPSPAPPRLRQPPSTPTLRRGRLQRPPASSSAS